MGEDQTDGGLRPGGGIYRRRRIKAQIDPGHELELLEAIDDRSFYTLAKNIDEVISKIGKAKKKYKKIKRDILQKLFNKTDIDTWFSDNELTKKMALADQEKSKQLKELIDAFIECPSVSGIQKVINELIGGFKFKFGRPEILGGTLKALDASRIEGISVYQAMKNHRNVIRRVGRKIVGKCLGPTLLTKGLEFDTVAILDAHKFDNPKHLYVALTRCRKNLIIFSENTTLSPYRSSP